MSPHAHSGCSRPSTWHAGRAVTTSFLGVFVILLTMPAFAQAPVTLVSVSSAGLQANDPSSKAVVSTDGRFVAFDSHASNLVPGDTNHLPDIFVHDRQTGETTRVNLGPGVVQTNHFSSAPAISGDGRFVAFESWADNLVPGDTNNASDVFVHDRVTGETTRVSVATGGGQGSWVSSGGVLSADGRFVAFTSEANNLVASDTNMAPDAFVHDRLTGETTRVSVGPGGAQGNGGSGAPSISADGQIVAFVSSASNLVPGDSNAATDVFVTDRAAGTTARVSVGTGGTQTALGADSGLPVVSADGRWVTFQSDGATLVAGDTNGGTDVFIHDRFTCTTMVVSIGLSGSPGNKRSLEQSVSADGRFVAFASFSTDLVGADTNGVYDIFVRDRQTGVTTRISEGPGGLEGDHHSMAPSISADGRFIAFTSYATTLVPGDANGTSDIFVRDRDLVVVPYPETLTVTLVGTGVGQVTSAPAGIDCGSDCVESYPHDISVTLTALPDSGSVFSAWSGACSGTGACTLSMAASRSVVAIFGVPGPSPTTARISVSSSGAGANDESARPAVSADGRFVAFESEASTLVPGDTNWHSDIFVHDRTTGTTTRVSVGASGVQANADSYRAAMSADGRFVAFDSGADNLVPDDTNWARDIFVYDRTTGATERVSVGPGGIEGDAWSEMPVISGDGRFIAFASRANNLIPDDLWYTGVFVHDRETHETTCVSVGPGGRGAEGNSHSPAISADGRFVAFWSSADNLVDGDTNWRYDVFVRDRDSATTTRIPMGPGGINDGVDNGLAISADGRFVAFETWSAVASDDTNGVRDVYVYDRLTGRTERVSVGPTGQQLDAESFDLVLSADGRFVAFTSGAANLGHWDTNGARDVFVHDRVAGTTTRVSVGAGGAEANAASAMPALSADGRLVAFVSGATNLVTDDTNGVADIFVHAGMVHEDPTGDRDRDGDGISDLEEFALGLDATKTQLFFAEGALQSLFETRFTVFNPNPVPVPVDVRFQPQGAAEIADAFVLPAFGRHTFDTSTAQPALIPRTGFATVFEAPAPIVADRTMTWHRRATPAHYASHAETAIQRPSTRWFLAEGSLIGSFRLYYLLQNPMAVPASVTVRYLFVNAPPCTDTSLVVPPFSRHTIEVHTEVPAKCGLANLDVSAEITADIPIIVERAMYLDQAPRPFFYAGHAAQGVIEPLASWRFAEGATGPFFDTFILVLNPEATPTDVRLTFLRQDGTSRVVTRRVPGNSRRTYWLDLLTEFENGGDFVVPREGGVSTLVDVLTPGKRVIAERAMWWPGPAMAAFTPYAQPMWEEAHVSAGAGTTATRWGIADVEAQGPTATSTYALVAITSPYEAKLRLTLHFTSEAGQVTSHVRDVCVAGGSRTTLAFPWEGDFGLGNCGMADDFFALFADAGTRKRFSVTIESQPHAGRPSAELVVERAQYSADEPRHSGWVNPYTGRFFEGPYWPAGSNALATPLPE